MARIPEFRIASRHLQLFLADLEHAVLSFLQTGREPNATQRFQMCNHDGKGIKRSTESYFGIRGFPEPPQDCFTDILDTTFFTDHAPRFSVRDIYSALTTRASLIWQERRALAASALGGWEGSALYANWNDPDVTHNYPLSRASIKCRLQVTGNVRVGAHWYSLIMVTNQPFLKSLPLLERQYIQEYIRVDDDAEDAAAASVHTLSVIVPRFNTSEHPEGAPVNGTTTAFVRHRGRAPPYTFATVFPQNNPAVQSAMSKAALGVQQTDDALAPSSLALLLMPLGLNVVPIALLTPVTTRMLVGYTVLSDVLSVIPLAVKGVELIVIGGQPHISISTRITAPLNGSRPGGVAAEVWGAECGTKANVRLIGIAFLSLALVFMTGGIIAEIWARRYVQRRTRLQEKLRRGESAERGALKVQVTEDYDDAAYIASLSAKPKVVWGRAVHVSSTKR